MVFLNRLLIICTFLCAVYNPAYAGPACSGTAINPVMDVCWECMWPARIGSIAWGGGGAGSAPGGTADAPGGVDQVACACPNTKGVLVGVLSNFWEHARLLEVVREPYCFPSLGNGLENPKPGFSGGDTKSSENGDSEYSFRQAHYYMFPVWTMMNLFMDFPCADKGNFDLAMMTEPDVMWQDDSLSFLLNPEALAVANPIAALASAPDAVGASAGFPIDALFWVMGSWGSFYPLSGSMMDSNVLNASAGTAAKLLYKLSREAIMFDTGINKCSAMGTISPILIKSHYRLQIARPVRGNACIPIGAPSLLWGQNKNPPQGAGANSPDNFMFVLTRARKCCVGYNVDSGSI